MTLLHIQPLGPWHELLHPSYSLRPFGPRARAPWRAAGVCRVPWTPRRPGSLKPLNVHVAGPSVQPWDKRTSSYGYSPQSLRRIAARLLIDARGSGNGHHEHPCSRSRSRSACVGVGPARRRLEAQGLKGDVRRSDAVLAPAGRVAALETTSRRRVAPRPRPGHRAAQRSGPPG
jgi:hypothetical protein